MYMHAHAHLCCSPSASVMLRALTLKSPVRLCAPPQVGVATRTTGTGTESRTGSARSPAGVARALRMPCWVGGDMRNPRIVMRHVRLSSSASRQVEPFSRGAAIFEHAGIQVVASAARRRSGGPAKPDAHSCVRLGAVAVRSFPFPSTPPSSPHPRPRRACASKSAPRNVGTSRAAVLLVLRLPVPIRPRSRCVC